MCQESGGAAKEEGTAGEASSSSACPRGGWARGQAPARQNEALCLDTPGYSKRQQYPVVSCCIPLYPIHVSHMYPTCIQVYPTVCILGRIRVGQIHIKEFEDTFHDVSRRLYPDVSRCIPVYPAAYDGIHLGYIRIHAGYSGIQFKRKPHQILRGNPTLPL